MTLNGNTKFVIAGISALAVLAGAAVSYGQLKANIVENATRITAMERSNELARSNPEATAVGSRIMGQLTEISHRLDRVEVQLEQIRVLLQQRQRPSGGSADAAH